VTDPLAVPDFVRSLLRDSDALAVPEPLPVAIRIVADPVAVMEMVAVPLRLSVSVAEPVPESDTVPPSVTRRGRVSVRIDVNVIVGFSNVPVVVIDAVRCALPDPVDDTVMLTVPEYVGECEGVRDPRTDADPVAAADPVRVAEDVAEAVFPTVPVIVGDPVWPDDRVPHGDLV